MTRTDILQQTSRGDDRHGALATALRVDISASRILSTIRWLMVGATVIIVASLSAPLWMKSVLILGIALVAWPRSSPLPPVSTLHLSANARWRLALANGELLGARLVPPSLALPWLIILRFKCARGCCNVVLLPDSCAPVAARRLRVKLRLLQFPQTLPDGSDAA
ncbi:MAG: hypothetical protein H6978_11420 [Gammaproteobacteria bacterium]|nr:hypothetical protein [Gammaproteobacteria bacterium]